VQRLSGLIENNRFHDTAPMTGQTMTLSVADYRILISINCGAT
jgi:hypothetical protein